MWDERLTTVEADRTMMETGIRRENRKEYVDMLAAVFILAGISDYLAMKKQENENRMPGNGSGRKGILYGKIIFTAEDGTKEEFYIEEQTRINGVNYLLVSDSMNDEANAYILKELPSAQEEESEYVMVDDEVEFEAVSGVFSQMLDDDVELEK